MDGRRKLFWWGLGAWAVLARIPAGAQANSPRPLPARELAQVYYDACMDEATIASRGTLPLDQALGQIAAIRGVRQIAGAVAQMHRVEIFALFPRSHAAPVASDAFLHYARRLFQLLGDPEAAAAAEARAAVEIAVGLRRAPQGQARWMDLNELRRTASNFDWRAYFAALGEGPRRLWLSPQFLQALNGRLLTTPLADWKSYLRFEWLDATAPLLEQAFAEAHFVFYGAHSRGLSPPPRQQVCAEQQAAFPLRDYEPANISRYDYFGDTLRLRSVREAERLRTAGGG